MNLLRALREGNRCSLNLRRVKEGVGEIGVTRVVAYQYESGQRCEVEEGRGDVEHGGVLERGRQKGGGAFS
jgi:hypothetical protein